MDDAGRENIFEFLENSGIKFPDFRFVRANEVEGDAFIGLHFRIRVREAEEFRVGCRQGLVVPRHVYFRDDLNAERCAVRHQLLQFLFGVHPFMGNSVAHAFFPFGGDAFEFGVAGHRKTPPLVVRQVDLELVEFVVGHHIHKFFQIGRGDEKACGIYHEAAPRIARLVRDDAAGDTLRLSRQLVPELAEGCQPVNSAFPSSGSKVRPLRGDCEPVGVRSQGRNFLVGKKFQGSGTVVLQLRFFRFRDNAVFVRCGGTCHVGGKNGAGQDEGQFKHHEELFRKRFYHGKGCVIRKNGEITCCFPSGRPVHSPECAPYHN